ncbi:S8 family serine peptidase [[Clostridium] fimetarium]|uniref:Subtilase family protein n=1 Tax=[Clostridium] fimetarium TaxID=99656 RepID=A0A1I0RPG1_9FIRM|nr:S8 family serine peptidase [[Clostridium] fimetarium]SEW43150.1 Subtilase family protein [[Clostridium] fimetarium]
MKKYNKVVLTLGMLSFLILIIIGVYIYKKPKISNDQWWISAINSDSIWRITEGDESVLIGIIDSGIKIDSEYLDDSIYVNKGEVPNNNIDDDNNGYIDDCNGWNFYDGDNEVYKTYSADYHGTMISGIISSNHINNFTYGIAPNVTIVPLKCFQGNSGDVDDVADAIKYGYSLGVRIFNCSWSTSTYSEVLYDTISHFDDAVFICAYSNLDGSKSNIYPATFDLENVISVGGFNKDGSIYDDQSENSYIDIYAPASEIECLLPSDVFLSSEGTSLATAFVTGGVALYYSMNYDVDIEALKRHITDASGILDLTEIGGSN